MAGRKENLKALFSNTRTRIIIIFTIIVLMIAVLIGIIRFSAHTEAGLNGNAALTSAPGIQSVPGSMDPTAQYAALQESQNVQQAEQANKSGGSAIPTIIRTQAFGDGVEAVGPQGGTGGVGFSTLAMEDSAGPQKSLWMQTLKDSNCSKTSVNQVVGQGATLNDLKGACTCLQLKDDGYQFNDLTSVCSCSELKAAGFSARQFKEAGWDAGRLRTCGFDACELRNAGFTAQQMKDGGFSDGELKGAGYSDPEIARAGGLPEGITANDVRRAGCDPASLSKLRAAGVSASAIRNISGCSAAQLKAAGYTAQDLKNAGFSAADLKNAGFSPEELRQAGYNARDLLDAGFSPAQLSAAGFTPDQIKTAEAELPPGMTADNVKNAGCDAAALKRERLAGVSAAAIKKYAGCSASALKAAGFTNNDLANAGFTPAQIASLNPDVDDNTIRAAGCDPAKLHGLMLEGVSARKIHDLNGCNAEALKAAGFDAKALTDAGFTPQQLLAAGFTPNQIRAAEAASDASIKAAGCDPTKLKELFAEGVSASRIRQLNGCSAAALKAAGYDAKDLRNAGFTPQQLLDAGFTPEEVRATNPVDDSVVRAAGCNPSKLHNLLLQGVSATRIRQLNGCNAQALKAAGFGAQSLAAAGFTPEELTKAGFTPAEVAAAMAANAPSDGSGVSDETIRNAGCDPSRLKDLAARGVSAARIRDLNGCSAAALKAAGYSAKDLANAGFTPSELLDAGFTPQQLNQADLNPSGVIAAGRTADCSVNSLKAARAMGVSASTIRQTLGCSASALRAAGYSAADLKNAGFTAAELKDAGFTAAQLKDAGFSAKELRAAGFSAQQLKDAGFSAAQLKDAGFSAADLKNAGFTADQLKAAGYSAKDLKAAGFSAAELRKAGYSAKDLKDAGYSAAQLRDAGYSPQDLQDAGFSPQDSDLAGLSPLGPQAATPSAVSPIPSLPGPPTINSPLSANAENARQLQEILNKQQTQLADQRYQQKIQQRVGQMLGVATQTLQSWRTVSVQTYIEGNPDATVAVATPEGAAVAAVATPAGAPPVPEGIAAAPTKALVKTGDILFAVLDTAVNSDEPGPILATIVSGRFRGAKLIGSFMLPPNADKMVISFNTMSVPSASKSTSISAYAIDPNTARTALSSFTNHHYLLRYGSLFAATFLEGFGNAFQSAGTTITIGGTGGVQTTTVATEGGRSLLENAVIGLATVGKQWGQVAQVQFNRPTTVQVCAGTPLGILFTQDLLSL